MNNPFDVKNYKSEIDWTKGNHAYKISLQQTAVVNRRRAGGVEPSSPYSGNGMPAEPERFAVDMPKLAKYDRNAARRRKNYEKQLLACKHVWLTLTDLPLYKCNECGTFLRIEK